VKATRRAAVAASGTAALGLAGCTSDASSGTSLPPRSSGSSASETPPADPDLVALDRAVTITTALLTSLEAAPPGLDPGGRLAALHVAHLDALRKATGTEATPATVPAGPRLTRTRLRRREIGAQRELAGLALAAESGALARLFASMSAGVAAALAGREAVR